MKILDLLNEYFGTEAESLDDFDDDLVNFRGEGLPENIFKFFKFIQRKEKD